MTIRISIGAALWLSCVGLQAASPENAYDFGGSVSLETLSNFDGGLSTGNYSFMSANASLAIDTAAANWWQGGEWFIQVLADYGQNPSALTGDVQGISNIAADNASKLYQFWYQHHFADDHLQLLCGLQDFNSTFYVLDSAALFTHPSAAIGPELTQTGPSVFPTAALTLHLTLRFDDKYLLLATYDGVPGDPNHPRGTHIHLGKDDGLFTALEAGIQQENGDKIALGTWQQTAHVDNPVDGSPSRHNQGQYLIGQKALGADTWIYAQLGFADDARNQIDRFTGAGVTRHSLWRDEDQLGLAVAQAHNGSPFLAQNPGVADAETTWDFTYLYPINLQARLQASLFYIVQPSAAADLHNATAASLRASYDF